jgi:hypothetical protein
VRDRHNARCAHAMGHPLCRGGRTHQRRRLLTFPRTPACSGVRTALASTGRGTGPWTFVHESGVCLWGSKKCSRRDGKRHPCFSECHSRKSPFPVSPQWGVLMDSCVGAREQR